MYAASRPTLLARLRGSARLAVLVLLVFALKIGAAAACVKHDLAEGGLGSAMSAHVALADADHAGDEPASANDAGGCAHAASHHVASLPAEVRASICPRAQRLGVLDPILPANAPVRFELRPPIA